MEINEKNSNTLSNAVAAIYGNLAVIYRNKGNFKIALKYNQLAFELEKELFDPGHPLIATSLRNLAKTYYSMGDFDNAEKHIEDSIKIQEKTLSLNNQLIIHSYNDYAIILLDKGNSKEAESILRKFITRQQSYLGEQNPQLVLSYTNLAYTLLKSKKNKEALSYANLSIKILKENSMEHTQEYKGALSIRQHINNYKPNIKPIKQSRNDKCACGSGKKYKRCHGA